MPDESGTYVEFMELCETQEGGDVYALHLLHGTINQSIPKAIRVITRLTILSKKAGNDHLHRSTVQPDSHGCEQSHLQNRQEPQGKR